jgi:hypothetical protein
MEKNPLTKYTSCDPDRCPLSEDCPEGPMPGLPCYLKEEYSKFVDQSIATTFVKMTESPETELRVNVLLKPLFEQLLHLRISELKHNSVYHGTKVNPLFRELRQCILAINSILTEAVKAYKVDVPDAPAETGGLELLRGKGYYEMLCYDGQASVENRVGPE